MEGLMLHSGAQKIGRQELLTISTPEATDTHKPIAHHQFVENIVQSLAYRKIGIKRDEYGLTPDGMRLFGFIQTDIERNGVGLGIGIRNANDRSFSLGLVAGFRTFVCDNTSFVGEFQVIAKKHTKNLVIEEAVATGIDRVQRRFEPLLERIDVWQNHSLPDIAAREIIYRAFIGEELDVPKKLARVIHRNYFAPEIEEFKPRTMFSLHSAFTSAFKTLDAVPGYRATADFAAFFEQVGN